MGSGHCLLSCGYVRKLFTALGSKFRRFCKGPDDLIHEVPGVSVINVGKKIFGLRFVFPYLVLEKRNVNASVVVSWDWD